MHPCRIHTGPKNPHQRVALGMCAFALIFAGGLPAIAQEDPIFSGPQVDEKLPSFEAVHARGPKKGEASKVGEATKAPTLLIFWHELGRPGFALLRTLSQYSLSLEDKGMQTRVVILTKDLDSSRFGGVLRLLPENLSVVTAPGGKDGPGSFGLNRDVRMTILVAKDQTIVGNFALVQPSVQVDGPKILESIAAAAGEKPPTLESLLAKSRQRMQGGATRQTDRAGSMQSAELTALLRKMLQAKEDEEIQSIAKEIEALVEKNKDARNDLARRATTIVDSGSVKRYGTEKTQEYIKTWAKKYQLKSEREAPATDEASKKRKRD